MKIHYFALLLLCTGCTYNISQQQISGNNRHARQAVGITNDGIIATQSTDKFGVDCVAPPPAPECAPPQPTVWDAVQGVIQVNVGPSYGNEYLYGVWNNHPRSNFYRGRTVFHSGYRCRR